MTQRKAHLDLFWEEKPDGSYYAIIPPVCEVSVSQWRDGSWGFDMNDNVSTVDNSDFGIPRTATADEMMDEVEQLSIAQIRGEFDHAATASRKGNKMIHKATRRTASLDLDWEETTDTFGDPLYKAVLPAIPGYPYSGDGNSTVSIGLDTYESEPGDEMYTWWMDIQVGKNDNVRFGDYELTGMGSYPLDYEMGYLDGLSVEWIADKLAEKGYQPDEDTTAGRHATRRTASMNLDWEKDGDDYVAQLPAIPGYTDDTGNGSFVTVTPYDFYGDKHWKAVFTIIVPDGKVFKLNNTDLGLSGKDTADEMMEEVESLRDPGEITYALYMEGYPNTVSFQGAW